MSKYAIECILNTKTLFYAMKDHSSLKNYDQEVQQIKRASHNKIAQYGEILMLSRLKLGKLKNDMLKKGFSSANDEINFFKRIKQKPLQNLVFYSEIRLFELKFPHGTRNSKEKYISRKLDELNRFFEYNLDFVQYIDSEQKYLDEQYFTRKYLDISRITQLKLKFYNLDHEFNTSHDLLLAKVVAYKKLAKYLEDRLKKLKNFSSQEIPKSQLKWTSSKAALTELTYALYHGGAVNNGNTDIIEIANALERTFNFPIGDVYRTYTEIRSRKNRRTKFLDELSTSLISGMDRLEE